MNNKKKRLILILLIASMLITLMPFAAASSMEKEEQYNSTILQLESWLDTPGKSADELELIVFSFDELKSYKMSKGFYYYSSVLLKAVQGSFDFDYKFWISMLEQNDSFQAYLQNDINSLSILSVPEMLSYTKGREAEQNGDITAAIGYYAESMNFYDASTRYESLVMGEYASKYAKAKELMNENDLIGAYFLFAEITEYDDSAQRMEFIISTLGYDPASGTPTPSPTPNPTETPTSEPTATPNPGPSSRQREFMAVRNIVKFGRYEQDNNSSNGPEEIEWIVLDYDEANHKALLISKYGLDAVPYNKGYWGITWEQCTLRAWLNGEFLNKAFSTEEQSAIIVTNVDNSSELGYSEWNTDGGNNTQDRIFLLSYAEANRYLGVTYNDRNNTKSRVAPTVYAIAQGAYAYGSYQTADGEPAGWWWLRSPGYNQSVAADVHYDGSLNYGYVDRGSGVVRPTFWLDLESDIF